MTDSPPHRPPPEGPSRQPPGTPTGQPPWTSPGQPEGPSRRGWLDLLVRVVGVAAAVWGAVLLALIGAFLTPLRIGAVLVPVSLALVIAGMVLLIRFTYEVTGHRLVSLLPAAVWLGCTVPFLDRTTEGDLVLIGSDWVATAYLFAGSLAAGVAGYRLFVPPRRRT